MLYTEQTVRENLRNRDGKRVFYLGDGDRLTASARDYLSRERIEVLPATQAACVFHKGSYRTFSESYEAVLRYIEENGYEIAGEIRESYIDGIWNKDDESQWLSEIQVPVRRK